MERERQGVSSLLWPHITSVTGFGPDIAIVQGFAHARGRPFPVSVATRDTGRFAAGGNEANRFLRHPPEFAKREQ